MATKLSKIQQKKAENPGGVAFKDFDLQVKAIDSQSRTISGIAATFGNIDRVGDRLHRGCFGTSIAERGPESQAKGKILLLWQHKHDDPIGRITKLEESDEGLYFEAEIDKGVESADRALIQLESGTINQFSIGFKYNWNLIEYNSEEDVFEVFGVKLFEISPVSIAADPETYYMGLKNDEDVHAEELILAEHIDEFMNKLTTNQQREAGELFLRLKSLSRVLSASDIKERVRQAAGDRRAETKQSGLQQIKFK